MTFIIIVVVIISLEASSAFSSSPFSASLNKTNEMTELSFAGQISDPNLTQIQSMHS